eukprot:2024496-Ditylum_brightwellii.AAC.1
MADAEVESGFNPPAIPFIPKSSTLKLRTIKSSTFASPPPTRCKLVDKTAGKFDLVEAILEGAALMHWLKFKWVEIAGIRKNHDSTDMPLLGKYYLCNHIKKPNNLSIKNTPARLCHVNSMLARFLVPGNNPMEDDELCNILYHMVKYDWQDALLKSGRTPTDMSLQDLMDYLD